MRPRVVAGDLNAGRMLKGQQHLKRETKVLTNSAKGAYPKSGRQLYGPNYVEKSPVPKATALY